MKYLGAAAAAALLGLLAAVVYPLAPVVALVGAIAAWQTLKSPFTVMLGFIAVLFLRPADFAPALAPLQLGKLLALGALALMVVDKMIRRDRTLVSAPQNRWMFALVVGVLISAWFGSYSGFSLTRLQDVFLKIVILYVLIVNLVNSPRRALALQTAIAVLTSVLGAYALYAKGAGVVTEAGGGRAGAVGLLGDPNDLALTLVMAAPFLIQATSQVRGAARLGYAVMLALVVSGILATQSRGGLLGLGAGAWFALGDRLKSLPVRLGLVGVAFAGLVVAAGFGQREDVEAMSEGQLDESAEGRLLAWQAGFAMFRHHPITGIGFERFPYEFQSYAADSGGWNQLDAHNSYVKALAETGVVGFVPWAMLLWLSFSVARQLRARATQMVRGIERAVVGSQLGNVAAFYVSAFFLSQSWSWFIFILVAQQTAMQDVYLPDEPALAGMQDRS